MPERKRNNKASPEESQDNDSQEVREEVRVADELQKIREFMNSMKDEQNSLKEILEDRLAKIGLKQLNNTRNIKHKFKVNQQQYLF